MATLVLRNVPYDLYQRLKETAAAHHRSMNQEAIVVLKGPLVRESGVTPKPTWEEFTGRVKDLWAMPVLDHRAADEIIGYKDSCSGPGHASTRNTARS